MEHSCSCSPPVVRRRPASVPAPSYPCQHRPAPRGHLHRRVIHLVRARAVCVDSAYGVCATRMRRRRRWRQQPRIALLLLLLNPILISMIASHSSDASRIVSDQRRRRPRPACPAYLAATDPFLVEYTTALWNSVSARARAPGSYAYVVS